MDMLAATFSISDAAVQSALSQNKLYQSNGISFFLREKATEFPTDRKKKRPGKPGFKGIDSSVASSSRNALEVSLSLVPYSRGAW